MPVPDPGRAERANLKTRLPLRGRPKKTILVAAAIAIFAGTAVVAQGTSSGDKTNEALVSRIDRIENGLVPSLRIKGGPTWNIRDRMEQLNVPGLAVAVFDNYEIQWVKGYGVADTASRRPITEETLFQAASISKPVAAMVAVHFVGRGLLDPDGDVNEKLRSWKVPENEFTRDEKVTVRRILSHTAGLSVPGSAYRYSGGGYTVLQLLIEDVTGRPLHELTQELVFDPLGMDHSS